MLIKCYRVFDRINWISWLYSFIYHFFISGILCYTFGWSFVSWKSVRSFSKVHLQFVMENISLIWSMIIWVVVATGYALAGHFEFHWMVQLTTILGWNSYKYVVVIVSAFNSFFVSEELSNFVSAFKHN